MVWDRLRRRGEIALGLALGIAAGRIGYPAALLTRMMITGQRQPIWRTPADVGLAYEDVAFPSDDGVALRGWFVRGAAGDGARAPAVVFVHGWPWNRLGNRAGVSLLPDQNVDFLVLARALSQAGIHTLLFDLRNHGQSGAAWPVTFGVREARDFVGAVALLRKRSDVDRERIGAIGFSMGANTLLYGIPRCGTVRAAVAVQPTSPAVFAPRLARALLGPAGPTLAELAAPLHQAFGAPALASIDLPRAAGFLGATPLLYIQGSGDGWGTLEDVRSIAAATPGALPLVVAPSAERFGGYLYVEQHPEEIVGFFERYLREN
jgi:fermentation-respiration switch protein FrsA (DUF1100 family)